MNRKIIALAILLSSSLVLAGPSHAHRSRTRSARQAQQVSSTTGKSTNPRKFDATYDERRPEKGSRTRKQDRRRVASHR